MNDESTREERIAAAEARQESEYAEGGTVEERMEKLDNLKAEILSEDDDEPGGE